MIIMKYLMTRPATIPAILAVASIFAVWPTVGYSGDAATGQGAQQIQLDPDTGEVVQPSSPTTPQPSQRAQDRQQSAEAGGPRAWTTDDGVQMLTPEPAKAPMARATQCPDGSLRIGHAAAREGESAREALCAAGGE